MQQLAYDNFINTIKSKYSIVTYRNNLQLFMRFLGITDPESLLGTNAEESVKQYIITMRTKISSATLHNRIASIYHFYDMNDVVLNKTKLSKFKGEFKRVKRDRAYSHEEIATLLQLADIRMKICILLMASAGLRKGAIPSIRIGDLEKIDNLYKITVYRGDNEEYYTFCSPECAEEIDTYLQYRKRCNEKITPDSYLIRNHFNDYTISKKSDGITKHTIHAIFYHILRKSGINVNVQMTHGFRKFFTTQCVNARINPEIREMLLGHKIGLASVYYKPTEQEILEEYLKVVNNLTINEENRLKIRIQKLEVEKSRIDRLEENFKILQKRIK